MSATRGKRRISVFRVLSWAVGLPVALSSCVAGAAALGFVALPQIAEAVTVEVPRAVMSDGKRTVELQGMVHVASDRFYREVAKLVERRREEGWLVFYEQVTNDVAESKGEELFRGIGIELVGFDPQMSQGEAAYRMVGSLLGDGLSLQDNRGILGIPGDDVRNVDISYSSLVSALPQTDEIVTLDVGETTRTFEESPGWLKERIRAFVKIYLYTIVSDPEISIKSLLKAASSVILDDRNRMVAQEIKKEEDRNVLVLYGSAHVPGIARELRKESSEWRNLYVQNIPVF